MNVQAPEPMSRPDPRRQVAMVLGQLAFGLLAMTICIPSMQEWGAILDTSQSNVQLTFSAYVVTYGGMQLLYGPLSDRLGRKRVLLFGLVLATLGSVLAAWAADVGTLVVARLIQGAGSAAGMVVGRAMVQDLFHGPERTRVMAWVGMAMGLCPPLATVVGGQLHVWLGWQANFVLMAGLAILLAWWAWRSLPSTEPAPHAPAQAHWLVDMLNAYAQLARQRRFVMHVAILAGTTSTFYAFLGGAPLVLGHYGVGPGRVGLFIMAIPLSYIVGNYLTSRLAHRMAANQIMALGQGLTLFGLALMGGLAAAGWHSPLAFTLPLLLLGMGHGLLVPVVLARTVGLVPALAGAAAAAAGVAQQLTGALGGYVVGWFRHNDAVNLAGVMLAFALMGAAAQALLRRQPAGASGSSG